MYILMKHNTEHLRNKNKKLFINVLLPLSYNLRGKILKRKLKEQTAAPWRFKKHVFILCVY